MTMVTLPQKILRALKNNRDALIVLTILAGMLIDKAVFLFDYSYYVHYIVGFTRSFAFFIFCFFAFVLVTSFRLLGLMVLVAVSMIADYLSLLSPELYYAIKPLRYGDQLALFGITINFITLYRIYEVSCVLFTFINWIINYIGNPSCRDITRSNGAGNLSARTRAQYRKP